MASLVVVTACARSGELEFPPTGASTEEVVSGLSLVAPFDSAELPTATPTLSATATGAAALTFEFQWSTDPTFASGVSTATVTGVASGGTASHALGTALSSGTTWYWRARASDGTWSAYTSPRSFTVRPAALRARWLATTQPQFDQGTFSATVSLASGAVALANGATSGTYWTAPVTIADLGGTWTYATMGGMRPAATAPLRISIEYWDGASWVLVPDTVLTNNSTGLTEARLPLHPLVSGTHDVLRARLSFSRATAADPSAELQDVTFETVPATAPAVVQNGAFEATGSWSQLTVGSAVSPVVDLAAVGGGGAGRYVELTNAECTPQCACSTMGIFRGAWVEQPLLVPSNATSLEYSFKYDVETYGACVGIRLGGVDVEWVCGSGTAKTQMWTNRTWPIPASLLGRAVSLEVILDDGATQWSGNCDHGAIVAADNFVVVAPVQVATRLAFVQQPTNTIAGQAISPAVQVAVQDASGAIVTTSNDPVTIALDANPGAATLTGAVTVNAINGVATFPNLSLDKAAAGYTFAASSGTLMAVTSTSFTVAPAQPSRLVFGVQPSNTSPLLPIAPSLDVHVKDAFGNPVPTATHSVSLALAVNPGSATLGGTLTQPAVAGVATFADVVVDAPGSGYVLEATSPQLTSVQSVPFTVAAPAPAQLTITSPARTVPVDACSASVTVQLEDSAGNAILAPADTVVTLTSDSAGLRFFTEGCISEVQQVTLPAGATSFAFAFSDMAAGTPQVTASAPGLLAASQAQTVTATPPPPPQFLTPPATLQARCGEPLDAAPAAPDSVTGGPLSFSVTAAGGSLPEGLTIDPRSGAVRWTPGAHHAGTHALELVATSSGSSGSAPFDIVVTCEPRVIEVSCGCSGTGASLPVMALVLLAALRRAPRARG